ncbi:SsgA family sporulation/cell division regulator [Streptomyces sp. NPDC054841]
MHLIEIEVMADVRTAAAHDCPVPVNLCYSTEDPLAVSLAFRASPGGPSGTGVVWVFARDLLAAGIRTAAGAGDVRVLPSSWQETDVELISPDGVCVVRFYTDELNGFLRRTYVLCPPGSEECGDSLERMLAGILGAV